MTAEAGHSLRPTRRPPKPVGSLALGLLLCVVTAGSAVAAVQEQRIALVLGQNKGDRGTVDLRYAEKDAQRVGEVLGELGGFQQVGVHRGVTAPTVLSLLKGMAQRVRRGQRKGQRALFLLYYSGHADEAGLQLGHSYLPRERLLAALSAIGAETTVVVVDACQTGGLNRRKGVTVVPPRQLAMVDRLATRGRADPWCEMRTHKCMGELHLRARRGLRGQDGRTQVSSGHLRLLRERRLPVDRDLHGVAFRSTGPRSPGLLG